MKILNREMYPELCQKGFQVADLTDRGTREKLTDGVVRAYKNVFNNSAWKEGVKCTSSCGFKTTFEQAPCTCPNCEGGIEDFYSNAQVKGFIDNVVNRREYKQALAIIGKESGNVGGFTWGWNTKLGKLNTQKLGLSDEEYKKLCGELYNMGVNPEEGLYYQSETGTTGEYRNKGLGKDLISLNQDILEQNSDKVSQILQRTSKGSPMYNIRKNQGYNEVYDYNDSDGRVLFAKKNK